MEACTGVGEGRGPEERKRGLERHHPWGRGSCVEILGLGRGQTGIKHIFMHGHSEVTQFVKDCTELIARLVSSPRRPRC